MFSSAFSAKKAYKTVELETTVMSASPHKLVLMLYDGAITAINRAKANLEIKDIAQKGSAISKAIDIIENGLKSSLDMKVGGDLATRLSMLYDYMCDTLLVANIKNDMSKLDEVLKLLNQLRAAWEAIADNPEALAAQEQLIARNQAQAQPQS